MKRLSNIIFLLLLFSGGLSAQTEIRDVLNKYTKVTSIPDRSSVYVSSSTGFFVGDTVMIAQMKGAIFSADPNVINDPAGMGKYELSVIGSINGTKISFNSQLKTDFNAIESVQLIRVPSYFDANVVDKLTAMAWDGEKGGVLVFVATNSLTLNADIDVSGKGFRGALPMTYSTGSCFAKSSFVPNNILNVRSDSTSGRKGEGAITNSYIYTMGRGPLGNGGGSGSGAFSGGGGGGNSGAGGNGGMESCAIPDDYNWGGNGARIDGQYFNNNLTERRIYLGGGGGSGIQKTSLSGTPGGNGGGVIIILTPYLVTNGYSIKASGNDVTGLVTDGSSSGGGGGGGTILLAIDEVKNNLNVIAKGGKGGSTASGSPCNGQGGGGGGGFVWFAGKSMNFSLLDLSGGDGGSGSCDVSSTPGNAGDSLNHLLLPLTGFLNNVIKAEAKTCYNTKVTIKGSQPQGGNGVYTYLWQIFNTGNSSWEIAPGINDNIHYTTPSLTSTSQFRRIVSSDGMNDISKGITINVFPQILNNVIDPDTVLCHGSSDIKIRGSIAAGGTGNFQYEWTQRTLTGTWEQTSEPNNARNLIISADVSRYYRRKAISEYCSTFDSVKVDVLPVISNNLVSPRQTICLNAIPVPFIGSTPEGGTASSYKFNWQKSDDSVIWTNTGITAEDLSYPPALAQTSYYRRIVSSGLNDCCRDTSQNIKIIVLPSIENNIISASQTICEATKPSNFTGSNSSGGDGIYRYQWESSKNATKWDSLEYSALIKDYQTIEQDSTHYFRRIVYSGLNDCCKNISNAIKVIVQPKIENNQITGDTVICDNTVPEMLKGRHSVFSGGDGNSYTPKWFQKAINGNWQDASGITNQITYQPPSLTDTIYYRRQLISGVCTDFSNVVTINVLNNIQGNFITGKTVVCDGFPSEPLSSESLSGGDPGIYRITWKKSTDGETGWEIIPEETNLQLLPGILPGETYFKRIVNSGKYDCCFSESNILKISIDKNPEFTQVGLTRDLIYQDTAYLQAVLPPVGSGVWSTSSDAEINNPNNVNTKVSGLKFGRYSFYWTVTNGICPSVQDSVILNLSDLQRYTGFSPNGDGINDQFIVEGLNNAGDKDITILNRWGAEVYHSNNYNNDWDGKNKNGSPLPEDTYYYILKVNDIYNPGKQRIYKGYVIIKR